jgi:hypothetical protein
LIGLDEALDVGRWPVAERYDVWKGHLYPQGYLFTWSVPLVEPDLFLSFARLAARGEPSKAGIRAWVHRHGLLSRADEDREDVFLDDGTLNQAMTLEDFRAEARAAYKALTLLEAIRGKNYEALRARLSYSKDGVRPAIVNRGSYLADVCLDGEPIPRAVSADHVLSDDDVLSASQVGLEFMVERKLTGVRLSFGRDYKHPRPLSSYRSRLVPKCPDLRSALWLQLGFLIEDKRLLRNCEVCGMPFPLTRPDRWVCNPTCRKAKSRGASFDTG